MNDKTTVLAGVFVLTILASAYFAASETALSMANRIRLRSQSDKGDRRAARALFLAEEDSDRTLITLLILTNIAHMAAASVATVFVTRLWGNTFVSACTFITTIIMFIAGESIPKNYAATHADGFLTRNSGIISFLVKICSPLSWIFSFISKIISKLLRDKGEPTMNEEDLQEIIDNIQEEGTLDREKTELIQSAMEFDDTTVQEVLTPRIDIVAIEDDMSAKEIIEVIRGSKHSRIPVYNGSIDNITGILSIRKYIREYLEKGDATVLSDLCEKPYFVYKTIPIDELLRKMSANRINMAVVNDEYGGTLGIITVEDVLEELVGEIWDEDDEVRSDIIDTGGNRYLVNADMNADDAFEFMGYEPEDPEEFEHKTIAAWVLENFDFMPGRGDSFTKGPLSVTIEEASPNRVVRVIIRYVREEVSEDA